MSEGDMISRLGELLGRVESLEGVLESTAQEDGGDAIPEELLSAYQRFCVEHRFKPGQLVRWKHGMNHKGGLEAGDVGIVMQVLDPPLIDESNDAGSVYFREPLDVVVGLLDDDDDFIFIHLDSRRLEPWDVANV